MAGFTAITIGLLAVGAQQSYKANEASKDAARAQNRANDVATAEGQVQDINARRQRARQERIRRSQIQQAAVNTGTTGSSGSLGAQSALATNVAAANASSRGSQLSAQGITNFQNQAAQYQSSASTHSLLSSTAFQFASVANAERT